jgi:hypothetical protein
MLRCFFGTDSGFDNCPANYNSGGAPGTCNGNGDGLINGWSNGATVNVENIHAWEHLSLAKLIPSVAMGSLLEPITNFPLPKGGPTWIETYIGLNMPASAYSKNIGYNIMSSDPTLISYGYYPPTIKPSQLMIEIGGSVNNDSLVGGGFTAPQAQQLDAKIDDGLPNAGIVSAIDPRLTGINNPNMTCLSGSAYSNSDVTGCVVYCQLKL